MRNDSIRPVHCCLQFFPTFFAVRWLASLEDRFPRGLLPAHTNSITQDAKKCSSFLRCTTLVLLLLGRAGYRLGKIRDRIAVFVDDSAAFVHLGCVALVRRRSVALLLRVCCGGLGRRNLHYVWRGRRGELVVGVIVVRRNRNRVVGPPVRAVDAADHNPAEEEAKGRAVGRVASVVVHAVGAVIPSGVVVSSIVMASNITTAIACGRSSRSTVGRVLVVSAGGRPSANVRGCARIGSAAREPAVCLEPAGRRASGETRCEPALSREPRGLCATSCETGGKPVPGETRGKTVAREAGGMSASSASATPAAMAATFRVSLSHGESKAKRCYEKELFGIPGHTCKRAIIIPGISALKYLQSLNCSNAVRRNPTRWSNMYAILRQLWKIGFSRRRIPSWLQTWPSRSPVLRHQALLTHP